MSDTITFLGTGGARVMMSKQFLATGGIWLNLAGVQVLLDPGPGSLVHCINKGLAPADLDMIAISHRHLDHCGDVNAMIEAMTQGGLKPRGIVMAPREALEGDPVILRYLRSYINQMIVSKPLQTYPVGELQISTSLPHVHGAETYGFCFRWAASSLAYLPDTAYFDELANFYQAQVLIISMLLLEKRPQVQHLSVEDARELIQVLRPRTVILTHFGIQTWQAGPDQLAERLSQATGINVIAAKDGMVFDLPISPLASR